MDIKTKRTLTDFEDFKRQLKKKGYRQLGHGAFASVWAKPYSKTVLKVGYTTNNQSYLDYLKLACKHQKNPHFPKISALTIYKYAGKRCADYWEYFAVEMEKLKELPRKVDFCIYEDSRGTFHRFTDKTQPVGKYVYSIFRDIQLDRGTSKILEAQLNLAKIDKTYRKRTSSVLNKLFKKWSSDLHDRNFMLRLNKGRASSELVFTDPVWDCEA